MPITIPEDLIGKTLCGITRTEDGRGLILRFGNGMDAVHFRVEGAPPVTDDAAPKDLVRAAP